MRIGIIGDAIDRQYAGIHFYTKNLIETLSSIDKTNEYFVFKERKTYNTSNFTEVVIPVKNWIPGYQSFRLFVIIPYLAKKLNLDVMVEPAHFGPFNLPSKIKRVTVIHDLTPLINPGWHTFNGWFLQRIFLPGIIRRADKIVTNSEFTKMDVVRLMKKSEQSVTAIHLGNSPEFKPEENSGVLENYNIRRPYLLYLGTIEPRKNLINLIKAYGIFRLKNPGSSHQLVIAGKHGWKYHKIVEEKDKSKFSDDIKFLGYVEQAHLSSLLTSCALFIYPSLYEGFGMPILEAMACGARVATSNRTSLPEIGKHYVKYFNPLNIDDMSDIIEKSISGKDKDREERIEYAKTFTWPKMAAQFKKTLESLA